MCQPQCDNEILCDMVEIDSQEQTDKGWFLSIKSVQWYGHQSDSPVNKCQLLLAKIA